MPGEKFQAIIMEYDNGWDRVDEIKEFDTKEERDEFVRTYNEKHNPDMGKPGVSAPAWSMVAKAPYHD